MRELQVVREALQVGALVHASVKDSVTHQPREALGIVISIISSVWHWPATRESGSPPTAWECDVMVDDNIHLIFVGRRDIYQPAP